MLMSSLNSIYGQWLKWKSEEKEFYYLKFHSIGIFGPLNFSMGSQPAAANANEYLTSYLTFFSICACTRQHHSHKNVPNVNNLAQMLPFGGTQVTVAFHLSFPCIFTDLAVQEWRMNVSQGTLTTMYGYEAAVRVGSLAISQVQVWPDYVTHGLGWQMSTHKPLLLNVGVL